MKNIFDRNIIADELPSNGTDMESFPPSINGNLDVDADSRLLSTPAAVKEITQELLKHGTLEEAGRPDLFRRLIAHEPKIAAALEPLDLVLRIDTHRGVAFLAVAPPAADEPAPGDEGWAHPLVRRQRLTLEQSLLVALLRQVFVLHEQAAGVGQSSAIIAVEDLLPQFLTYFEDSGSDARNESRLLTLLDQLKAYGIVSEVDKKHELTIRPLIAHLANPESLTALLNSLKERSRGGEVPEEDANA